MFALIGATLPCFVMERSPTDITAVASLVTLFVLGGYTGITTPGKALAEFSAATITLVAMYVLSASVREPGLIECLGRGWRA